MTSRSKAKIRDKGKGMWGGMARPVENWKSVKKRESANTNPQIRRSAAGWRVQWNDKGLKRISHQEWDCYEQALVAVQCGEYNK